MCWCGIDRFTTTNFSINFLMLILVKIYNGKFWSRWSHSRCRGFEFRYRSCKIPLDINETRRFWKLYSSLFGPKYLHIKGYEQLKRKAENGMNSKDKYVNTKQAPAVEHILTILVLFVSSRFMNP